MERSRLRLGALIAAALILAALLAARLLRGRPGSAYDADPEIKRVQQLVEAGDTEAVAREVSNTRPIVARAAVAGLGQLGPPSLSHLQRAMGDERWQVREQAVAAYRSAAGPEDVEPLARVARTDPSVKVRATAVTVLGHMRAYREMELLMDALEDGDAGVRRSAVKSVQKILGMSFRYRADDPPEKRRKHVEFIRKTWQGMKKTIEAYYELPRIKKGLRRGVPTP